MERTLLSVLLLLVAVVLCGCADTYSASDMEQAKEYSYNNGYDAGYSDGLEQGREEAYEECLIDGQSIRYVQDQFYREYGMTPSEAFSIIDEYEYDSSHGGITWSEYRTSIESLYYLADIFPEE